MGNDLRVRLFGTFEVWQDNAPISAKAWPQRKTQTLLKILVSQRGQVFTQDQLIDMLFVDIPYDNASRNLHKRISELRRLLEPDLKRGAESQFVIRSGQ